jgi:hypothetical protein
MEQWSRLLQIVANHLADYTVSWPREPYSFKYDIEDDRKYNDEYTNKEDGESN